MANKHSRRGVTYRRTALALALGMGFTGLASGQATTGSIFGQTRSGSADTVVVQNATGLTREATVDASGRYNVGSLPLGTYTVTLKRGGETVDSRSNVVLRVGSGTDVSFGASEANARELSSVTVTANALPSIDVTSVDSRTVITSQQLATLPLARSAEAIALLAPGVVQGSSYFVGPMGGSLVSFGGSSVTENAYYLNGFNTTDPLSGFGGISLPYGSIDQQEILSGGYGAAYGRSDGGVISQVGKRGTNDWHFGGMVEWTPTDLQSDPKNYYYVKKDGSRGAMRQYRKDNKGWTTTIDAYLGGPLIKDKLFLFTSIEAERRQGQLVGSNAAPYDTHYRYDNPKWYAKLDWNINDSNILELTGVSDKTQYFSDLSRFNYNGKSHDDVQAGGLYTKNGGELYIGKYTGYITDSLTVSALYGEQKIDHVNSPWNYDPTCPRLSGNTAAVNQMPGITYYPTCQYATTVYPAGSMDKTKGGRLDVEYRIGDHAIHVGADSQSARSITGDAYAGGYIWVFQQTADKNAPINAGAGVGSPASAGGSGLGVPGATPDKGYFVRRQYYTHFADVKVEQSSQFIEDRWQLNDRMLLVLGLRNEQFTNYNSDGLSFMSQRNQLAPRLGFSWDVHGDSSLKLFANAGRYHLAPPNNVAVRGAAASLYTQEYFTYTGTDPKTGAPTGLTPVPVDASLGYICPGTNGAVSSNHECGESPDPRTVSAKNMKSHFQDEYILGMEQQLTPAFNWGAKLTFRNLRSAIDDTCTPVLGGHCLGFNPGVANTFEIKQPDGSFKTVTFTNAELGMPQLKRRYYALDLFAERPFDGTWYGKLEYTFSRNYGNTEGQLLSDNDTGSGGQADVSRTQDWDLPQLMVGSNGVLPNNRTHQVKAFGYYQITPEWRVGATAYFTSGRPKSCTSYYPTPDKGLYNGAYYHFCGLPGSGTAPGTKGYTAPSSDYALSVRGTKGSTPWVYTLNLNVAYIPEWANKQLTLQADVLNVFNQQVAQFNNPQYAVDRNTRSQFYDQELGITSPRSVRLSARYDFSL